MRRGMDLPGPSIDDLVVFSCGVNLRTLSTRGSGGEVTNGFVADQAAAVTVDLLDTELLENSERGEAHASGICEAIPRADDNDGAPPTEFERGPSPSCAYGCCGAPACIEAPLAGLAKGGDVERKAFRDGSNGDTTRGEIVRADIEAIVNIVTRSGDIVRTDAKGDTGDVTNEFALSSNAKGAIGDVATELDLSSTATSADTMREGDGPPDREGGGTDRHEPDDTMR